MTSLNRREALFGAVGLGLAGAATSLPAAPARNRAPVSPEANLDAVIRMVASRKPGDIPWWYNGTIYAIVGEEQPRALVKFEGMELYWMQPLGDGQYEMTGNTVTFFRDVETDEMIDTWKNPYTGETVEVTPAVQGGRAGRGFNYSVNGIRPTPFMDAFPDTPLNLEWSSARDSLWLHNYTNYPPGMPPPRMQRQSMFARREEFEDDSVDALAATFTSTVFMPWLKWMGMGDRPGHVVWHASGAKLRDFDDLPADYRKRAETEYPERMTADPNA